jgi:rubredoxin
MLAARIRMSPSARKRFPRRIDGAQEAHDFQAVGKRCREAPLAFVRDISALVEDLPENPPEVADFNGWTDLVANVIAPGPGAERRRGYLKASAKATWELVNWLTHATGAARFDAYFGHHATGHVLTSWGLSVLRHDVPDAQQCPECGSYRLAKEYDRSEGPDDYYVTVCRICGWVGPPVAEKRVERPPRDPNEELGPCVTIDVPLRGPTPPKPSRTG